MIRLIVDGCECAVAGQRERYLAIKAALVVDVGAGLVAGCQVAGPWAGTSNGISTLSCQPLAASG